MATIDLIIIGFFLVGAVIGLMKGFIKQLAALLGLVAGLVAAKMLYVPMAEKLTGTLTENLTVAQVISFVAIWLVVPLLFALLAAMLTKTIEIVCLGWMNRWLGAGLGALKYTLVASLLIGVIEYVDANDKIITGQAKQESVLYKPVGDLIHIFIPVAQNLTKEWMEL